MLGPVGDTPLNNNLDPVRASKPLGKPITPAQKALWSTCQDFESVMLGMVLKQMRSTVQTSDPLGKGMANQTYREMLDDEMGKQMARSNGIGLAEGIYRQLKDTV